MILHAVVTVQAKQPKKTRISSLNLSDRPNSTPKTLNTFKSVENLLMTLSKGSKHSSECQDASEGYSSSNILDLSPIPHVPEPSGFRREKRSGDLHSVTRYETAFGPDNNTVTRVFYADGIATDFNHENGEVNNAHTPIETHFESSSEENTSSFSRKNGLRNSVNNLFHRAASVRQKKSKKDKVPTKRRSVGDSLNDDRSYGCSVGVYSRTMSDTSCEDFYPRSNIPYRSASVKGVNHCNGKPPKYGGQSTTKSMTVERSHSKTHEPVMNGAKSLRRKKSLSSASLHHRKSFCDSSELGKEEVNPAVKNSRSTDRTDSDPISGRSLSLSDLAIAPPIENDLQKQCIKKVTDSEDSEYNFC